MGQNFCDLAYIRSFKNDEWKHYWIMNHSDLAWLRVGKFNTVSCFTICLLCFDIRKLAERKYLPTPERGKSTSSISKQMKKTQIQVIVAIWEIFTKTAFYFSWSKVIFTLSEKFTFVWVCNLAQLISCVIRMWNSKFVIASSEMRRLTAPVICPNVVTFTIFHTSTNRIPNSAMKSESEWQDEGKSTVAYRTKFTFSEPMSRVIASWISHTFTKQVEVDWQVPHYCQCESIPEQVP